MVKTLNFAILSIFVVSLSVKRPILLFILFKLNKERKDGLKRLPEIKTECFVITGTSLNITELQLPLY